MAMAMRQLEIRGETVLVVNPDFVLVKSQSEADVWHAVETLDGHPHCTCKGFSYRRICRHLRVANAATDPAEAWERGEDVEYAAWLELHAFGAEVLTSA